MAALLWTMSPGCADLEERSGPLVLSPAAESPEGTFGRIALHAYHHWNPGPEEPEHRMELSVVFVQYTGVTAQVAQAQAGLAVETLPLEPGACAPIGPQPLPLAQDLLEEEALVDLLDAGAIHVVVPSRSTLLRPRLFPDVLPHVSGVHYRATLHGQDESFSLRLVRLQGFGGRDVGSFELTHRSGPEELRILQVAQSAPWKTPPRLRASAPLTVRWTPTDPDADLRVTLRWKARGLHTGTGLECRPASPGEHTFSAASLAQVDMHPDGQEVTIGVSATHRASVPLPEGIPVRLHLSQSDAVTLLLTP